MTQINVHMDVRRASTTISIIDIQGDLSALAESVLMNCYTQASSATTRVIILNFTNLAYMNSSGIGLLVTLLIRVQRHKQQLLAFGLSEHYQRIFELTRLSDVIRLYNDESEVLAVAQTL
jgi:anti-sigma B factor antagonist